MEIVRNFINISGIDDMTEMSDYMKGQIIQFSETETIFLPKNQPDIKSIFQIIIKVELKSNRSISTPLGKTAVLDGVKKLKVIYTQNDDNGKANFIDMELPFNTFIELKNNMELENISIHVLDAYFSLLDERKIYSHYVFMLNIPDFSLEFNRASDMILKEICSKNIKEAVLINLDDESE